MFLLLLPIYLFPCTDSHLVFMKTIAACLDISFAFACLSLVELTGFYRLYNNLENKDVEKCTAKHTNK